MKLGIVDYLARASRGMTFDEICIDLCPRDAHNKPAKHAIEAADTELTDLLANNLVQSRHQDGMYVFWVAKNAPEEDGA